MYLFVVLLIKIIFMVSVFLNLGEGFKDDKLNIFRRELAKRMEVFSYDYARENLELINKLDITTGETGHIFYFETDVCRKNKNYIKAFSNLVTCITTKPSAVYLMPYAPKELVNVICEQWQCDVYLFQYDVMKPAVKIK